MASTSDERLLLDVDRIQSTDREFGAFETSLSYLPRDQNVSGIRDQEYPMESQLGLPIDQEEMFVKYYSEMPDTIKSHMSTTRTSLRMGFLSHKSYSWIALDSDLFLWNYETGDMGYYSDVKSNIEEVVLVRPNKGVFSRDVEFLLGIFTANDISIIGVTFSSVGNVEQIEFSSREPLHNSSVDVFIRCAAASQNGRILFGGGDGCVYEVRYQDRGMMSKIGLPLKVSFTVVNHSQSAYTAMIPSFIGSLFGQVEPIISVVVDDLREVMYARTDKHSLLAFDISNDQAKQIAVLNNSVILSEAAHHTQGSVESSDFRIICSICPISPRRSAAVCLCATTSSGIRLYFSIYSDMDVSRGPSTLQLVHVRMPPGYSTVGQLHRPRDTHLAYCDADFDVFASWIDDTNDSVWMHSSAQFGFLTDRFRETVTQKAVNGRAYAIDRAHNCDAAAEERFFLNTTQSNGNPLSPAVIARQHVDSIREVCIITTMGVYKACRQTPLFVFRRLLRTNDAASASVKTYFDVQRERACYLCLCLIAECLDSDPAIVEAASRAFFLYGGDPKLLNHNTGGPNNMGGFGNVEFPMEVEFSQGHFALLSFFARTISAVWNGPMVKSCRKQSNEGLLARFVSGDDAVRRGVLQFDSCLHQDDVIRMTTLLRHLKIFLNRHSSLANHLTTTKAVYASPVQHTSGSQQNTAADAQRESLLALHELLDMTCEVLGLWSLLLCNTFSLVVGRLPLNYQEQLGRHSLRTLVTQGRELCGYICMTLVTGYLGDSASVDDISVCLRDVCPKLFSASDAATAKASELIQMAAKLPENSEQRATTLDNALHMFKQVITSVNLQLVCSQFERSHFYSGIVDLCLAAAHRKDPSNLGEQHYEDQLKQFNLPEDANAHAALAYRERMSCYQTLIQSIQNLLHSESRPSSISAKVIEETCERMLATCLQSDDLLCHYAIYDWMIDNACEEKMLLLKQTSLEHHLRRQSKLFANVGEIDRYVRYTELLCRVLERNGTYQEAADVLQSLAHLRNRRICLTQRVEYLSKAAICIAAASQSDMATGLGQYSAKQQELQDQLELATLQSMIIDAIRAKPRRVLDATRSNEVIEHLELDLYPLQELYEEYALRFDLWVIQLAIWQIADVSLDDEATVDAVETCWARLIESACDQRDQASPEVLRCLLVDLSRKYGPARSGVSNACGSAAFPEELVVKLLAQRALQCSFHADWFAATTLEMKIPPSITLATLCALCKTKTHFWFMSAHTRGYLFELIHGVVRRCLQDLSIFDRPELIGFVTSAQDAVDCSLVELDVQAVGPSTAYTRESFKNLQKDLRNMEKQYNVSR